MATFIGETTKLNFAMKRGDTKIITFQPKNKDTGELIVLNTGDIIHFTVKSDSEDLTPISFQKEVTSFVDGKAIIHIIPSDTDDLIPGTYYYDIQWTTINNDKYTTIEGMLKIEGDYTRD